MTDSKSLLRKHDNNANEVLTVAPKGELVFKEACEVVVVFDSPSECLAMTSPPSDFERSATFEDTFVRCSQEVLSELNDTDFSLCVSKKYRVRIEKLTPLKTLASVWKELFRSQLSSVVSGDLGRQMAETGTLTVEPQTREADVETAESFGRLAEAIGIATGSVAHDTARQRGVSPPEKNRRVAKATGGLNLLVAENASCIFSFPDSVVDVDEERSRKALSALESLTEAMLKTMLKEDVKRLSSYRYFIQFESGTPFGVLRYLWGQALFAQAHRVHQGNLGLTVEIDGRMSVFAIPRSASGIADEKSSTSDLERETIDTFPSSSGDIDEENVEQSSTQEDDVIKFADQVSQVNLELAKLPNPYRLQFLKERATKEICDGLRGRITKDKEPSTREHYLESFKDVKTVGLLDQQQGVELFNELLKWIAGTNCGKDGELFNQVIGEILSTKKTLGADLFCGDPKDSSGRPEQIRQLLAQTKQIGLVFEKTVNSKAKKPRTSTKFPTFSAKNKAAH